MMTDLLEVIQSRLNVILPTYLEQAPQGTQYPFITYSLNSSQENFIREIFILEINVWDQTNDTTALEGYADEVDLAFHRYKYFKQNVLQTSIYRMNRGMIPDPDPLIKRRQLLYECKTYLKRSE